MSKQARFRGWIARRYARQPRERGTAMAPFACALLLTAFAGFAQAAPTLCFFSLNNEREFELTRAFLLDAGRQGGGVIDTLELHQPQRELDAERSFRNMLDSGEVCDGLVISGHHTGSFSGARARGSLTINALEEMSCAPRYRGFFRHLKAVWLQGCRTLGARPLAEAPGIDHEFNADYHMQRVGAELMRSGVRQSFAELSFEFSSTLDQDNPLASRYLRVFPAASVFGWTRSSPGFKAKSEKSLLYHMAHMTQLSRGVPLFDPSRASAVSHRRDMSEALGGVLAGAPSYQGLASEAWLSHGKVKRSGFGYDNPDLATYAPLLESGENRLLAAGDLGCDLRNAGDTEEMQRSLARIIDDPFYAAHNLNAIWEIYRAHEQTRPESVDALRTQLLASETLMALLRGKLISPSTGLLMKIEYYGFYRALTGESNENYERLIRENVVYFMFASDLAGSSYDIRDFREALLLSLYEHRLAGTAFYDGIIQSPDVPASSLYAIAWSFLKHSPPESARLMDDIVHHLAVDGATLNVAAIWLLNNGVEENGQTLEAIVTHPGVDNATLGTVASILIRYPVTGDADLVAGILEHERLGQPALGQAALAVRRHGIDLEDAVLERMINHPAVEQRDLRNLAVVLARREFSTEPAVLEVISRHPLADAETRQTVELLPKDRDGAGGGQAP